MRFNLNLQNLVKQNKETAEIKPVKIFITDDTNEWNKLAMQLVTIEKKPTKSPARTSSIVSRMSTDDWNKLALSQKNSS